jgi:F-box/WD-40 domain protein 7
VRTLKEHISQISQLVVHNNLLFSASWDRTVKVWDLDTFRLLRPLQGHTHRVHGMAVVRDHLFTGSADHSVKVWELDTFSCRQTLQHSVAGALPVIKAVAGAGGRVAFGGDDCTVTVWDLERTVTHTMEGHSQPVSALVFDGQSLVSASYDGTLMVRVSDLVILLSRVDGLVAIGMGLMRLEKTHLLFTYYCSCHTTKKKKKKHGRSGLFSTSGNYPVP